jgi:hypothetical protein
MRTEGKTDRRTGMTNPIVALRYFANVPKNCCVFRIRTEQEDSLTSKQTLPARSLLCNCSYVLRYKPKCNFIYAYKKSEAFPVQIFAKFTSM